MLSARLTDLDELAQATRDPVSRAYVQEAIDAYRAGAYRTTIVAVWIAVIVDIIDKLRELALSGDANAPGARSSDR
jgi:hypothetical protein